MSNQLLGFARSTRRTVSPIRGLPSAHERRYVQFMRYFPARLLAYCIPSLFWSSSAFSAGTSELAIPVTSACLEKARQIVAAAPKSPSLRIRILEFGEPAHGHGQRIGVAVATVQEDEIPRRLYEVVSEIDEARMPGYEFRIQMNDADFADKFRAGVSLARRRSGTKDIFLNLHEDEVVMRFNGKPDAP